MAYMARISQDDNKYTVREAVRDGSKEDYKLDYFNWSGLLHHLKYIRYRKLRGQISGINIVVDPSISKKEATFGSIEKLIKFLEENKGNGK